MSQPINFYASIGNLPDDCDSSNDPGNDWNEDFDFEDFEEDRFLEDDQS